MHDGGRAFPSRPGAAEKGMSLLDWPAGQALAGLMTSPQYRALSSTEVARRAYLLAHAALEARDN